MKLVVLDGHTLNPGDLSWSALEALAECTIYARTPAEEVVSRCHDAELVLSNKTVVNRASIEALPQLRYIGVLATGYNNIDVAAARERGIPGLDVPAYGTQSVAQMTWALLLELCNRVGHHAATVEQSRWSRSVDFCYADYPLKELNGLTLGVVGFGRIGQAVAKLGLAFGMRVLVATRSAAPKEEPIDLVERTTLENLLSSSDVVSLHCPLTDQTKGLINPERLALMKPTAILLNTSRGPLIDEHALRSALISGRLGGAALDVLSVEPPPIDHPLIGLPNCLITPHIAWATQAARSRLLGTAVANVAAFLAGQPRNVVNPVA